MSAAAPNPIDPPPAGAPAPAKGGRGCIFWLTCLLAVMGLVVLGLALSAWWTYRRVASVLDTAPVAIEAVAVSPESQPQLQQRFQQLESKLRPGGGPLDLSLSAEDINGLLASVPRLQGLSERLRVESLEGNRVTLRVSIPLDAVQMPGKYFNGPVVLALEEREGRPVLRLVQVGDAGRGIPQFLLNRVGAGDLLGALGERHPVARVYAEDFAKRWRAWQARDDVFSLTVE